MQIYFMFQLAAFEFGISVSCETFSFASGDQRLSGVLVFAIPPSTHPHAHSCTCPTYLCRLHWGPHNVRQAAWACLSGLSAGVGLVAWDWCVLGWGGLLVLGASSFSLLHVVAESLHPRCLRSCTFIGHRMRTSNKHQRETPTTGDLFR